MCFSILFTSSTFKVPLEHVRSLDGLRERSPYSPGSLGSWAFTGDERQAEGCGSLGSDPGNVPLVPTWPVNFSYWVLTNQTGWQGAKLGKWSLAARSLLSPAEFSLCHRSYIRSSSGSALKGGTWGKKSKFSCTSFELVIFWLYLASCFFSRRLKAERCPLHLRFLSASDLIFTSGSTYSACMYFKPAVLAGLISDLLRLKFCGP